MLQIVPMSAENRLHLKRLNTAWLEKYFHVEPADMTQLSEPEQQIIAKGGYVFFALYGEEVCGTVSLLKIDAETYELSKLCVDESFQGRGIGRQLILHAITHAQILRADKLILYSHSRLKTAFDLYLKFGFREVPLGQSRYRRSNLKMELELPKRGA